MNLVNLVPFLAQVRDLLAHPISNYSPTPSSLFMFRRQPAIRAHLVAAPLSRGPGARDPAAGGAGAAPPAAGAPAAGAGAPAR